MARKENHYKSTSDLLNHYEELDTFSRMRRVAGAPRKGKSWKRKSGDDVEGGGEQSGPIEYSRHATERATEREVPYHLIDRAVRAGRKFLETCDKPIKIYHPKSGVSVTACLEGEVSHVVTTYWGR